MNQDALLNSLLIHEGLRLKPYTDPAGKLTIGVGRNLTDDGITEDEARLLCLNDIAAVTRALDEEVPWWRGINEVRQNVLAEMCFNLGWHGLSGFHRFLACLRDDDFGGAASEMIASQWARQVGHRAADLAHLMRTGVPA
jgi:lysozyme